MHFNGSSSAENKFAEAWGQQDKPIAGKIKSHKRKILLLGSSHVRHVRHVHQEQLGTECVAISTLKPNTTLSNVVEN
jgi:hypothetical protein